MNEIETWLNLAKFISKESKDPRTKVGAVIIDDDDRIVSTGRNGMVSRCNETELWEDKYPFVIHAEMNAAMFARRDLRGCRMYCTLSPCVNCLKHIIQMGIRVIYYDKMHDKHTDKDKEDICKLLKATGAYVFNRDGRRYQDELSSSEP